MLAFWTGADSSKMDSIFRKSGLFRDKWNARRGATTYGEGVINKAISDCRGILSRLRYRGLWNHYIR